MTWHAPGDIPWEKVWESTATRLDGHRVAGLQALLTEDVLRFAVVQELVEVGVAPKNIEAEWRRPMVPDAVDLVVLHPTRSAIEFKFPREPRETNAAWTQHLGEVIKDLYRLAHMPTDFANRWCVQLLSNRMLRYLDGVSDRRGVRIGLRPGDVTILEPDLSLHLPPTAAKAIARWQNDGLWVRAQCRVVHDIGNELRLVAHTVEPASAGPGPSDP